jgi:hypothetical protein
MRGEGGWPCDGSYRKLFDAPCRRLLAGRGMRPLFQCIYPAPCLTAPFNALRLPRTLNPSATAATAEDALIVYAAMSCPGACARSPFAPPVPPPPLPPGAPLPGATTVEAAAAEVVAAAAATAAMAAAPLPQPGIGEDARGRPPLALPQVMYPAAFLKGGGGAALAAARPMEGVRIGVFDEVRAPEARSLPPAHFLILLLYENPSYP